MTNIKKNRSSGFPKENKKKQLILNVIWLVETVAILTVALYGFTLSAFLLPFRLSFVFLTQETFVKKRKKDGDGKT